MSTTDIPMRLTVGRAPAEGPASADRHQNTIVGPELSGEFVRYLDHARCGWSPAEQLLRLQEFDPRASRAYTLHQAKHGMAQIAAAMGVSVRTAQRLVRRGRQFVAPEEWREARGDDARLAWLRVHSPEVSTVLELREHGYRQEQIAEMQHITVDRVEHLASRGRAVLGDGYWYAVRRRRQVRDDNREEVPTEVIAERKREREEVAAISLRNTDEEEEGHDLSEMHE